MSFNNSRPAVRPAGDNVIELLEPLVYQTDEYRLSVPMGFVSDGASVPDFAWLMLRSSWIDLLPFAIVHDFTYRTDSRVLMGADLIPIPGRWWADREACRALRTLGPEQARDAWKVRFALILGGRRAWHRRPVGLAP